MAPRVTTLANTVSTDVVNVTTTADNSLPASTTTSVYALNTNQSIGGGANAVLQLGSGGLNVSGGTMTTSALDFNGVEGILGVFGTSAINSVVQNTAASGNGLTIFGSSALTLGGASANTFTGNTTIEGTSTLTLNKSANTVALPGNVFVNLGATLSESASGQLTSGANVTVSGTWNLNNNSESIASLTINNTSQNYGLIRSGGAVNTGAGTAASTLTVGSLTINAGGTLNLQGTNATANSNVLTVSGSGTTTLTSSTIDGALYTAFLNISDKNTFNTGTGGLNLTGGDIRFNTSNASLLNLNGNVAVNASPASSFLGDTSGTKGQLALGSNNIVFSVADGGAVDDLYESAQIPGTNGFTQTGPGQMHQATPSTASSYTGNTTILNGTLLTDYAIPNGTIEMGSASQAGNSTFLINNNITNAVPIAVNSGRNRSRHLWPLDRRQHVDAIRIDHARRERGRRQLFHHCRLSDYH